MGKRNRQNYYRLVPQLGKASPEMDNVRAKNIYELIQAGLAFVDKNRETLTDIARKLIRNK